MHSTYQLSQDCLQQNSISVNNRMTIHRSRKLQKEWLTLKGINIKYNVMLTEETVKDEERRDVEQQTQQLSNNHQIMPRTNSQCNHQQLSQDECRERNWYDVDEVVLKQ